MPGTDRKLDAQDGVTQWLVEDLTGRERRTDEASDQRWQRDRTIRWKNQTFIGSELVLELLRQDVVRTSMRSVEVIRRKWRGEWHQNQRDERERKQPAGRMPEQTL